MREELGDVLLQSVFQARVCESDTEDPFGIDEVADRLVNKLITRHPHVFAADDARSQRFSGRVDRSEDFRDVLNLLQRTLLVKFEVDGNKITITK